MNQSRKKISLLFVTRIMLYNKIDFQISIHYTSIFESYKLLYLTFLFNRTVKKTRRILELYPSKTLVVSSLSSLLASSLLSSSLHLSSFITRQRIPLWSRSQSLVKMSKRLFNFEGFIKSQSQFLRKLISFNIYVTKEISYPVHIIHI